MHCLGGRVLKPELLDTLPPDEARASLNDLVRLNARWGGLSTLRKLMQQEAPEANEEFSFLDVGAASGDMGAEVRRLYPRSHVTSLDYLPTHLRAGADAFSNAVAGDAFALPVKDESFDFVFCSLFLHHFTNGQIVELLSGFRRAARRAVLVIDLERHPVSYYFMAWTRPLFGWDPVTVHDGAISVEAGFKTGELIDLAERAGLHDVRAKAYWPAFRIALRGGV